MASSISRVKAFRVENDVADWIEGKSGFNRVLKSLYDMDGVELDVSDGEIKIKNGNNSVNTALKDLEGMMKCLGGTLDEGIEAFRSGLEDGSLEYRDGKIVVNECEYDLSRFIEACTEKCVDPQSMIDKMTQNIYRS